MAYTASVRQPSDQHGCTIIFRHPARIDEVTGKPGKRVHQGLGTRDRAEADRLKDEMNELLADPQFWTSTARPAAAQRFDARIVEIFFNKLTPEALDFGALRDKLIELRSSAGSDYRRVLLLGTTGAGKTTLLRQLIGSNPDTDRFPSTSSAKTTVADTEIVLDAGPFRAVVTFVPRDEVREHVEECVSAAVLGAYRGESDADIMQRILSHGEQRYRFNYVLGNGPSFASRLEHDHDDDEDDEALAQPLESIDLSKTNALLSRAHSVVKDISLRQGAALRESLDARGQDDMRVVDELFEDELDSLIRDEPAFSEVVDELMDEIELRFDNLEPGEVGKTKQGWPIHWHWETNDRDKFIRTVLRFSSNYAPLFGSLLTPLVNGIRVAGPFQPTWPTSEPAKLVLIDGEGLGHTAGSAATLPSRVTKRLGEVDAVLLVDNAEQPMQAGSVAVLRALVYTGNVGKLLIAFTHFDGVRGDNLPRISDRELHVRNSLQSILVSIGDEIGPQAERMLRARVESGSFFLGGIDRPLDPRKDKRTISQFTALLSAIGAVVERVATGPARPEYDRLNLVLAIKGAADNFHDAWLTVLGLRANPGRDKEHWTRVKALSRRLATGTADEYDTLRPIQDLHMALQRSIRALLERPIRWSSPQPDPAEAGQIIEDFAKSISDRVAEVSLRRLKAERLQEWMRAYGEHGYGSTFRRADIIAHEIYDQAAPTPTVTPSPDRNRFLHEVVDAFEKAATEAGIELR
jgi:energy-coupling factor transporter ATP-binding protein EcfA2